MPLHLIAVLCPAEIEQQVRLWKNFMLERFGTGVALKSPAHITLIPPFHLPQDNTSSLIRCISDDVKDSTVSPATLKNFSAFPPRVIFVEVLANPSLTLLKQQVEKSLLDNHFPIKPDNRPFHPHITIANRDLKTEDFPAAWNHFSGMTYQAVFPVQSIAVLIHDGNRWQTHSEIQLK